MTASKPDNREARRREAAARARQRGPPKLPEWPADQPRPSFKTETEEVRFLSSYSFGEYWAASSKRSARKAGRKGARAEVYRLRLSPEEREALEARARAENVPASFVLRELIGGLKTQVRVSPGATALLPKAAGGFAHLNVENLGAPLVRVRCWVQFFRSTNPSRPLFPDEMPARWSWAPEPFSGSPGAREIDYFKISQGHIADFATREEHAVAIALKLADGTCWGWTPDSYVYEGRHPKWELPAEPLLVRARILANGRDYFEQFQLDAQLAPADFKLRAMEGEAASKSTSSLAAEVEQLSRLRLIPGGRG